MGQAIDISLFQTGVYVLGFDIAGALVTGKDYADWRQEPPEEKVAAAMKANREIINFYKMQAPNPLAAGYITQDGRIMVLVALQPDRYWEKLCKVIERDDLVDVPRFNSTHARMENREVLYQILEEAFLTRTLTEWKPRLEGMPYASVQNLMEVINDPQARANDYFVPVDHPEHGRMEVLSSPIHLSQTPATLRTTAPEFGQHTEEVLLEHGYSWEDIIRLKDGGVIA